MATVAPVITSEFKVKSPFLIVKAKALPKAFPSISLTRTMSTRPLLVVREAEKGYFAWDWVHCHLI